MATHQTIRAFEYRNGRFGTNVASLEEVRDCPVHGNYWLFRNGFGDPFFEPTLAEAEDAFARFTADREAA